MKDACKRRGSFQVKGQTNPDLSDTLCINNFSGSSPIQLESTEGKSLVNTHQLQCCLQLKLTHDSVDMRPNTYKTTRTSTSRLQTTRTLLFYYTILTKNWTLNHINYCPKEALLALKQTTDTRAASKSSVCRHTGHQQMVRPNTVSDPSVPTCWSLGAPRHS